MNVIFKHTYAMHTIYALHMLLKVNASRHVCMLQMNKFLHNKGNL